MRELEFREEESAVAQCVQFALSTQVENFLSLNFFSSASDPRLYHGESLERRTLLLFRKMVSSLLESATCRRSEEDAFERSLELGPTLKRVVRLD